MSSGSSGSEQEDTVTEDFSTGWSEKGPRKTHSSCKTTSAPKHPINNHSTSLSLLQLVLDANFCAGKKPSEMSSRATSYHAKSFKPVLPPELKAYLCLRLQMENCVIKLLYGSYWQGARDDFISCTPSIRA